MILLSPFFNQLEMAQEALRNDAFFLFDIHQVLFHRKGFLPLMRGLTKVKCKKRVLKQLIAFLSKPSTWNALLATYRSGNRVIEAYFDAASCYPELYSALLDYSNDIYTPDETVQFLLQQLDQQGYQLFLLSNIGPKTFQRLKTIYTDYFFPLTVITNTINDPHYQKLWKPHHSAYEKALETLQFEKRAHLAVFIDDKECNVKAAQQAGFNAIQFKNSLQLRLEISTLLGKSFTFD